MILNKLKKVFWDVNLEKIDEQLDRDFIISRVLSKGTDADIALVENYYSSGDILRALTKSREVSEKTLNYYRLIFRDEQGGR